MVDHETAGVELVPVKHKNLPLRILRAFYNAKHLTGLKRGIKDTLAELCRFVPQNQPFDTIFAHKATIAARIGASERTIYRHLETLREHHLIEVLEQDRKSRNGRFTVSRIRLTRKAAVLLGFIEAPEEIACLDDAEMPMHVTTVSSVTPQPATSPVHTVPASIKADATKHEVAELIPSAPSAKMTVGHTLSVPTISKNQPPQRTQNGLPIDLAWMTGNGLSRAGIFKLMKKAKNHGKRLSDIVIVVHDYIQDLKGGRLYSYLAKLADGPTDFAVAAANERKRLADAEKTRVFERKVQVFRSRFRNTALTNRAQTRLYLIDPHARFVQILGGPRPGTMPLSDLGPWINGVETGELVLATLETERRFQT